VFAADIFESEITHGEHSSSIYNMLVYSNGIDGSPSCQNGPMSTQHAILGLMEGTPRHGYDLKRSYDELFAEMRPLRFSQIYATLARLERDGLVELVDGENGQGPERKTYAITSDGVTDLEQWFQEPEPAQSPIDSTLFLKVTMALLSGRPARKILERQRSLHNARMRELTKAKTSATDAEATLLDYALFHLEADLRWMDHTVLRLETMKRSLQTPA
jgi:DNA-binding PadR family transcriptional regulator